ncbi:MAG: lysophospholipid acyltransferase family protein [Actinomycetota bacterium]
MNWRVVTTGSHHIPTSGPAVIATNHVGYLDFVFVGYAARERKRLVRFMAKQEVFGHPIAGPLMRGMRHIPADRYGQTGLAIERSIDAVRAGEIVGMFPEGTISRSFVPAEGKTGAARIAMEAGAPLTPGVVWGSQRILTKGRPKNLERGVTITVDLGAPIDYSRDEDPHDVTDRLMKTISEGVALAERRYPEEPHGLDDRWWLPAHLGGNAPTVEESRRLAEAERAARRKA